MELFSMQSTEGLVSEVSQSVVPRPFFHLFCSPGTTRTRLVVAPEDEEFPLMDEGLFEKRGSAPSTAAEAA